MSGIPVRADLPKEAVSRAEINGTGGLIRPERSGAVMAGEPLRQAVKVANPLGLHMRPAAAFATVARQFRCTVAVWRAEQRVDGKSLFDLLLLGAEPGTELIIEVDGEDASEALPALADILAAGSIDDAGPPPKG